MEKTIIIKANLKMISVMKQILNYQETERKRIREYLDSQIVGFSITDDSINRQNLSEELRKSELEIESANVIT
nr:hypothetical protein [uncultured Flavobacterium sp.]